MAEKKLGTIAKVLIGVAVVGVTGTVAYYAVKGIKNWRDKRNQDDSDQEINNDTSGGSGNGGGLFGGGNSGKDSETIPSVEEQLTDPKAVSFQQVKKYFGNKATVYTDKIELSFTLGSAKFKVQFFNNGRFFIFMWSNTSSKWMPSTKGDYKNGGKYLLVTEGAKKGQIKQGSDVLTNVKNAF